MAPAQVVEPKDLPPELMAAPVASLPAVQEPVAPALVSFSTTTQAPAAPSGDAQAALHPSASPSWLGDLEREARRRLDTGEREVWDALTRQFEGCLIHTALDLTRGRRIEAAQRLGIGRNTITRKIQELGLDD
jgi:two-component system nitrogen regulation response regulator GlnG